MAFIHGKETKILIGPYDVSAYFNSVTMSRTRQLVSTDVFGNDDKTYLPGLGEGSFDLGGLWDNTATTGSDAMLHSALSGGELTVTVSLQGASAIAQRADLLSARQTTYPWQATDDDVVSLSSGRTASGNGGIRSGVILKEFDAETSTANFTSVDNAAATTLGSLAHLHVTAFTGTNAVIKVAESSDNSSFVDYITFSTVTGATSERNHSEGNAARYMRCQLTGTFDSITFTLALARHTFS